MKLKRIILTIIFSLVLIPLLAQQQTEVLTMFEKYGKQQGSVLVHLSEDILSQGSNLTLYKSLIVDNIEPEKKLEILNTLSTATKKWSKLNEIKKGGLIESATYYINNKRSNRHHYLLIKGTNKKLTIIYIEGDFEVDQLQSELKKLKGLFIYVNEKRIKIQ